MGEEIEEVREGRVRKKEGERVGAEQKEREEGGKKGGNERKVEEEREERLRKGKIWG